jgi:hypothetical protein
MAENQRRFYPRYLETVVSVLLPALIFSAGIAGSVGVGTAGGTTATTESIPAEGVTSSRAPSSLAPTLPPVAPTSSPDSSAHIALDQLSRLADAPSGYLTGYDRDFFGHGWIDTDQNGCDTRNDVLERDLTVLIYKPNTEDCVILSGELDDPYTGSPISFVRGTTTSILVQIDHVVPLAYVWQVGAATWTRDRQVSYANDPRNLLAVDGRANQVKSADGPSGWMPPNEAFHCAYIERFVGVLFAYQLEIKADDRFISKQVLETCR